MRVTTTLILSLLIFLPFAASAQSLSERLSGYILLQVEEHGEAWYVNPENKSRYYMKDGATAYEMMRSFGLGITDSDLNNIPSVSTTEEMKSSKSVCASNSFAKKQSGKILLQVQQHGEAWYVYPDKCLRIYLKDGEAAYSVMRFLGLGIKTVDLLQVQSEVLRSESTLIEEVTQTSIEPAPQPDETEALRVILAEQQRILEEQKRLIEKQNSIIEAQQPEPVVEPTPEPIPEPLPEPERHDIILEWDSEQRYFILNDETPGMDCTTDTNTITKDKYNTYYGVCSYYGDILARKGPGETKQFSFSIQTSKPLVVHGDVVVYGSFGSPFPISVTGTYRYGTGDKYFGY